VADNGLMMVHTSYHSTIKMYPFQALYGYSPLNREIVTQKVSLVVVVEEILQVRVSMDQFLHKQLEIARHRIKQVADRGKKKRIQCRSFYVFEIATLQPCKHTNDALKKTFKVSP
jgi:hypothetical protein